VLRKAMREEFDGLHRTLLKNTNRRSFSRGKHPEELHDKAEEFLDHGTSARDPAEQYALIQEAYILATTELDNYGLAKASLEALIARFAVDGIKLRRDFLIWAERKAQQPGEDLLVARLALQWAELAVEQKRYGEAEGMCRVAVKMAHDADNDSLVKSATERIREIEALRMTEAAAEAAVDSTATP
jgi:hypothetical protein